MAGLIYRIRKAFHDIYYRLQGNSLAQDFIGAEGALDITPGMPETARRMASEGIVMLKNTGALPLAAGERVSFFGRCHINYFYVGYGSGGDIHPPYRVSPLDAALEAEKEGLIQVNHDLLSVYESWCSQKKNMPDDGWWGNWPLNYPEMPVSKELAAQAAESGGTAVIVIGRAAGEDRDTLLAKGSYYLTDTEEEMIANVTEAFSRTVIVMDCGNLMDMLWTKKYNGRISAILYAWQGGMESGNALMDVLTGRTNPSGHLTDTIAKTYLDYPTSMNFGGREYNNYAEDVFVGYRYLEKVGRDHVMYPFGYGLSYTTFRTEPTGFDAGLVTDTCTGTGADINTGAALGTFSVSVRVTNTGTCAGKEVVQIYAECPEVKMIKPSRVLVGFAKTRLLEPGESQELRITGSYYDLTSYDDNGVTGHRHAFVLEEGTYIIYAGSDVRTDTVAGTICIPETTVYRQCNAVCGTQDPFERYNVCREKNEYSHYAEMVPARDYDLKKRIMSGMPEETGYKGDKGHKLQEVADGTISLDEFVSQLTDYELEALTRGYAGLNAPQGIKGNAGAYGGILPSLEDKGIPPVITSDGPSGVRVARYTSLLPCGTAIASSWNTELATELYSLTAKEMAKYGTDVLLGVGMNLHRNPICGRNFEYYSEDPFLTGKMAAAVVRGIQSGGKGACIKHFACNNQETARNTNDSRVSERALRELYFRGFEIAVKESDPADIMVSYNKINGVWSHYSYDLATTLLRDEWGFKGLVITDWWMQKAESPDFPGAKDNAYRIKAQVDVLMPGNMNKTAREYASDGTIAAALANGSLTRGELERCARNTLINVLRLKFGVRYEELREQN